MKSSDDGHGSISADDLLAGKPVPMDMRLQVNIVRGTIPEDLPGIPRVIVRKIAEHQDRIYEWLARSPVNRSMFLTDTVAALQKVDVGLVPEEVRLLQNLHSEAKKKDLMPWSVNITEFSVELADAPSTEKPGKEEGR
ncbi:MAG: hypothetical protein QOH92_190 [Chloroflexota bacterium]|jgi:hypothetical protein|nr:hypothetical protein [Chloroflexota bacterium]